MATPPEGSRRHNPYALLFCAAFLYVFINSYSILSPILLAFLLVILLALAANPAVAALRRKLGGRSMATGLIVIFFLVIAGLTGWGVYQPLKKSTSQFLERLPQYWERVQKPLLKLQQKAAVSEQKLKEEVTTEIIQEDALTNSTTSVTNANALPERVPRKIERPAATQPQEMSSDGFIQSGLSQAMTGIAGTFKTVATNAFSFLMIAITVFVGVIFTLINPRPIMAFTFGLVPEVHHDTAQRIATRIIGMIPRWAFATLLGMGTIGTLVFLSMWFILGFQDALVLGLIAFVLEAIPYVGPILAVIPAILLAFGKGGMTPLWVIIAYACIQAIENNLVAPLIMAGRLKLHPLAVLFAILLCAITFGVLGAILAAPLVVIFNIFYEEIYRPRFLPNVSGKQLDDMAGDILNKRLKDNPTTSKSKQK
ncbi:MAG: AI-2E family transporter [Verrucomicrobia bacterium]|nr:AI-2E family transporter [Verrucomicrobiota bacterium]